MQVLLVFAAFGYGGCVVTASFCAAWEVPMRWRLLRRARFGHGPRRGVCGPVVVGLPLHRRQRGCSHGMGTSLSLDPEVLGACDCAAGFSPALHLPWVPAGPPELSGR